MKKALLNITIAFVVVVTSPCWLLFCIGVLLCWPFVALWNHYFPAPQRKTPVGLLTKGRYGWYSPPWEEFPGLQVIDRDGEPDPEFLARLPMLFEDAVRISLLAEAVVPLYADAVRNAEAPWGLIAVRQETAPDREFTLLFGEEYTEEQDCVELAIFEGQIVDTQFNGW